MHLTSLPVIRPAAPAAAFLPASRCVALFSDDAMSAAWGRMLAGEGLRVCEAPRGAVTAIDAAADAIVLYVARSLPEQLAWLRELASRHDGTPVLVACRHLRDMDQVLALEMGADDVVDAAQPAAVVAARLRALWRRGAPGRQQAAAAPQQLDCGDLSLRFASRQVLLRGELVALTEGEFEVLWLLAQRAGHVVTRAELLRQVRGLNSVDADRSIDTRIYRIRLKLGDMASASQRLRTIRNRGYLLSAGH